jgi:hypothetical protein
VGVAAIALLIWFIWPAPLPPVTAEIAALPMHSETGQPWQCNHYRITPLEPFKKEALVLHTNHYSNDRESQLSPVDFALGWGPMADPAVLKRLNISQSGRWYNYRWGPPGPPISEGEIISHSKNMHMIPANTDIQSTLLKVHKGQTVKITGYLVRAEASDGWRWVSSQSFTSGGSHSCMLVWVDSIDVK